MLKTPSTEYKHKAHGIKLKGNKRMKRYTQTDKSNAECVLKNEETGDAEKSLLQKIEKYYIQFKSINEPNWLTQAMK